MSSQCAALIEQSIQHSNRALSYSSVNIFSLIILARITFKLNLNYSGGMHPEGKLGFILHYSVLEWKLLLQKKWKQTSYYLHPKDNPEDINLVL